MPFMGKLRAQGHYAVGTRILMSLHQSSSITSLVNDLEKAVKRLQKATELDPHFADAFHNLAHAWHNVAEYNVAAAYFKGYWVEVEEAEDYINTALQFALDAVDRAIAIRYEFPYAHNTRAGILAKLGRLDEAMEATEVALSQAPGYKNAIDTQEKIAESRRRS